MRGVFVSATFPGKPGRHEKQVGVDDYGLPVIRNVSDPIRNYAFLFGAGFESIAKALNVRVPLDAKYIKLSGKKAKRARRLGVGLATNPQLEEFSFSIGGVK